MHTTVSFNSFCCQYSLVNYLALEDCDEYSWDNKGKPVKHIDTLYFEKLPMKGIEAFDEVPLGNKTNKSFIVKRPSETKSPISLHDDKGKDCF